MLPQKTFCLWFPHSPELLVSTVCSHIKNLFAWSVLELNSAWPFTGAPPKIGLKAGRFRTCQTINDWRRATLQAEGERCRSWHSFLSRHWEIINFTFQNKQLFCFIVKVAPRSASKPSIALHFLDILLLFHLRGQHTQSDEFKRGPRKD